MTCPIASFWSDLASGVLTGLIVSALTLLQRGCSSDRRYDLKRLRHDRQTRDDMRTAVLSAVHRELESNAAHVQTFLRELPKGAVPWPGFDTTGWPLISQAIVFTTLTTGAISELTHAYNRMNSANEQLEFLADLNHGRTAVLVNALLADPLDRKVPLANEAHEKFLTHGDSTREMLLGRISDLKGYLDRAIDAVEAELGLEVEVPAAERMFEPDPAEIG